jgi:hypothetical protein
MTEAKPESTGDETNSKPTQQKPTEQQPGWMAFLRNLQEVIDVDKINAITKLVRAFKGAPDTLTAMQALFRELPRLLVILLFTIALLVLVGMDKVEGSTVVALLAMVFGFLLHYYFGRNQDNG